MNRVEMIERINERLETATDEEVAEVYWLLEIELES